MANLIRRLMVGCLGAVMFASALYGQEETEYRMELGGAFGGSYYMGDANYLVPYKDLGWCGGVVARYIFNPRMHLKANLIAGKIAGDTRDFNDVYPYDGMTSFSRMVYDVGAQFEYNFLAYGTGRGYNGGHRFTPYLLAGFGFTFTSGPTEKVFAVNFPLGIGVKYKLAPRWNVGCEVTMRFCSSDRLDVTATDGLRLEDPFLIKGKGLKNNDSYSFTVFYITYDLFARCRDCNN